MLWHHFGWEANSLPLIWGGDQWKGHCFHVGYECFVRLVLSVLVCWAPKSRVWWQADLTLAGIEFCWARTESWSPLNDTTPPFFLRWFSPPEGSQYHSPHWNSPRCRVHYISWNPAYNEGAPVMKQECRDTERKKSFFHSGFEFAAPSVTKQAQSKWLLVHANKFIIDHNELYSHNNTRSKCLSVQIYNFQAFEDIDCARRFESLIIQCLTVLVNLISQSYFDKSRKQELKRGVWAYHT